MHSHGLLSLNLPTLLDRFGNSEEEVDCVVLVESERWNIRSLCKSSCFTVTSSLSPILPEFSPTVQVIGDCYAPFSESGTSYASELFRDSVNSTPTPFVLWGLTGNPSSTPTRVDTNQIVNNWIDEDPETRSPRAIACVVDAGTRLAITEWKCLCPTQPANVRNFLTTTGGAEFGDDIHITDALTDTLLVLEGGVQSFLQILSCAALGRTRSVLAVRGLRSAGHSNRFSASELLHLLITASVNNRSLTDTLSSYLSTLNPPLAPYESGRITSAAFTAFSSGDIFPQLLRITTIHHHTVLTQQPT